MTATGTQDTVRGQSLMRAEEMLSRSSMFIPDHFIFYQKNGGFHDFDAVQDYLYNALPLFWQIKLKKWRKKS